MISKLQNRILFSVALFAILSTVSPVYARNDKLANQYHGHDIYLDDWKDYLLNGMTLWSLQGNGSMLVPVRFAYASKVFIIPCESKGDPDALGDYDRYGNPRAFGEWQLRIDVHGEKMASMGLDFFNRRHRLWYIVQLWKDGKETWRDWSCKPS